MAILLLVDWLIVEVNDLSDGIKLNGVKFCVYWNDMVRWTLAFGCMFVFNMTWGWMNYQHVCWDGFVWVWFNVELIFAVSGLSMDCVLPANAVVDLVFVNNAGQWLRRLLCIYWRLCWVAPQNFDFDNMNESCNELYLERWFALDENVPIIAAVLLFELVTQSLKFVDTLDEFWIFDCENWLYFRSDGLMNDLCGWMFWEMNVIFLPWFEKF